MSNLLTWSRSLLLLAAAIGSSNLYAQDTVMVPGVLRDSRDAPIPVRVCPTATAVQCATEYYKLADDQLNVVYLAVRKRLQSLGLTLQEENLVQAQRAWIRFRDAHCTYVGDYAEPGKGKDAFFGIACMEVETIRRTFYLQPHSR